MWFFGLLLAVAGLSSFRTADIAVSRPDRAQRRSLAKLERSYEYIRKMYVSLQIYDKRTGKAIDNRYLFLMFALEFFISAAFCRRNIWTATNYVVFLIKYYTQFP